MPSSHRARVAILTGLALLGFAANSLLCRAALRTHAIDAASFTSIRLATGAATLALIARLRLNDASRRLRPERSWSAKLLSAGALFAYAIAFSFAYVRLSAGIGALLLFGAVQTTMVGWAIARGERPGPREWLGLAAALGGLLVLTFPSLTSPPPLAAASMMAAGSAWGFYSLLGRGSKDPVGATASNFTLALPLAIVVSLLTASAARVSTAGATYAAASGAIASGIGYSLWYAALPSLSATRAGIVQLAVPLVAAVGGVFLFGERVTGRLAVAACAILGGIALATLRGQRRGSAR